MTALYARYERLLFAYPREWRRHRGAEIAATYTEMAADGQRWPRGRDAASLLLHGLRTRLGRPGSRVVVPLTVLAMLVGGLCAAAAGARAGWGATTGLSSHQVADANQLAQVQVDEDTATAGGGQPGAPTWLGGYLAMPVWDFPATFLVRSSNASVARQTVRALADKERARLTAAGWKVTDETVTATGVAMTVRHGDAVAHLAAYAQADGTIVVLAGIAATGDVTVDNTGRGVGGFPIGPNGLTAIAYRTTPATVPVFAMLAGLLGAIMTYLLIGWVNRRSGRFALVRQRMVAAGLTLTTALAAPAAAVCGAGIWTALRDHSDVPIRYWGGFVVGEVRIATLVAAVLLVATVTGIALARPTWRETEVAQ